MAPAHLTDDEEFRATCFVVIDFEATTPTGHRPEPVDVAAMALRLRDGRLAETARFCALMAPPDHAPLTRLDTEQTGITADMLAGQPDAATVLAALDIRLDNPPYLLVAHNAPTEAGILFGHRAACPRLAGTDFLDTVRLARVAYPELSSHRLDMLIHHLGIAWPTDRHRAMPDVEVTAEVFRHTVEHGAATGRWRTMRHLRADGGYPGQGRQTGAGLPVLASPDARGGTDVSDDHCRRGRLISIEGLNGVGKTHLTTRLLRRYVDGDRPVLLEEFSQRPQARTSDLSRELLRSLIAAADGDPFLRGGHPGAETLLLLAIKMFDFEAGCAAALAGGRTVIEGRSVHSIAVYQSLITQPDDETAHAHARTILDLAAAWRPLPDLTLLITDDVATAVRRAEARDRNRYTDEQWRLHHRAADLFDRLAADDPRRVVVLDRRRLDADALIDRMAELIGATRTGCLPQPATVTVVPAGPALCPRRCRPRVAPA